MLKSYINKLYGNLVVLRNLPGQDRIPYLPKEKLWALRDARLQRIVKYAAETVPYYQNLFKKEKIDPCEIRSIKDLDYLPLIDKKMVLKDPTQFVSNSRRGKKSISFITSGTTGMPLKVYHDPHSLLANIAFGEREREVISKMCGKAFVHKEIRIVYSGSTLIKVEDFYRQRTFIPIRPKRLTLFVSDPFEYIIEMVNAFRPDIILGYGAYLETAFRILASKGIRIHRPLLIIYGGDSMTAEGRNFVEESFGIPVLSIYNAMEAFKIGFFCEERRGFHIHEDLCSLKIVNEAGQRVVEGEKGEVVISNLVNHGTVLLNYRLGDAASMSNEICPCGRTLPLLSKLEGRVEDIIFMPDGRFIHPRLVWEVIKRRDGILKYQLVQYEPKHFELRLVTVDKVAFQRVVNGILSDLHGLLGESVIIESDYYEELKPQEGGKFKPVLSYCRQANCI
jgi:phenylacetate-CoA ligase